jgi:hypothetical protein
MKLVSMTLPEDPALLASWLEGHLVGLRLADLVAELEAVHTGPTHTHRSVGELLGSQRGAVLGEGLGTLPAERLRELLRSPRTLLDLQDLIFTEGGPYWSQLPRPVELRRAVERGNELFLRKPDQTRLPWYRRAWVVSLATAAAVLLAVELPRWLFPPAEPELPGPVKPGPAPVVVAQATWGWDKPGALPQDGAARDYYLALVKAAEEWEKKRPQEAPDLAQRIGELRRGCSTLIFASHKPLPERERRWLVGRCRVWGTQIDRHLEELEAGTDPATVRDGADRTVRQIIAALSSRADSV